jgi:hypothetical protein
MPRLGVAGLAQTLAVGSRKAHNLVSPSCRCQWHAAVGFGRLKSNLAAISLAVTNTCSEEQHQATQGMYTPNHCRCTRHSHPRRRNLGTDLYVSRNPSRNSSLLLLLTTSARRNLQSGFCTKLLSRKSIPKAGTRSGDFHLMLSKAFGLSIDRFHTTL